MLINCPECNKEISDKAIFCPNCGFPLKKQTSYRRASQNRYKKLPNGFGSIKHLSGKRRKPYACYPPVKEWVMSNGKAKAVTPKAIGYFATYNEAYSALCDYNKSPYDTDLKTATFKEIYELLLVDKFDKDKNSNKGTRNVYVSSFKLCEPFHDRVFSMIKEEELQGFIDALDKKRPSIQAIKNLLSQMYKYTIKYNLGTQVNIGANLVINKDDESEMGIPFTEKDIAIIKENAKDSKFSRFILIMIYSGLRISEIMGASEIDLEKGAFIGGVKTKSGKERIVPFHSGIVEYIPELIEYRNTHKVRIFRINFNKELEKLGLLNFGDGKVHTPHDCRHTFSWLADKYNMDDYSKHFMMGHSFWGDVEKSVYGHRTFEELKNEIEKICC